MDKKEFLEKLQTVAVIQANKPPTSRTPVIKYVTEVGEDGEEYQVAVEVKHNPTLGFKLVGLKDRYAACELGCGDIVNHQSIERRFCTGPKPHWRTQCKTCGCYPSPNGDYFVEGAHNISAEYVKWFNVKSNTATPLIQKDVARSKPSKQSFQSKKGKWVADSEGNINYQDDLQKKE